MRFFPLAVLSSFLSVASGAHAQRTEHRVSVHIDALRTSGTVFRPVELFHPVASDATTDALWTKACRAATVLRYDRNAARELLSAPSEHIALALPEANGLVVLDLERVDVTSDGFDVKRASDGDVVVTPLAKHFRGSIRGVPGSLAAISVFENEVMGLIADADGQRVLGRFKEGPTDLHVLYRERDLRGSFTSPCGTVDAPLPPMTPEANEDDRSIRCVHLYWEAAFEVFQDKGSVANVTNYLTGLFNQSATLYANDGVNILLQEVFVWDVASPYNATSSGGRLSQFGTTRTTFNGELAHLIDYAGYGGVAWLNVLCSGSTSSRMGYSGIYSTFQNVPTYSWSVEVVTHEMGHNMGSPHTHACSWNGNNTAIDGCGPTAGYSEGSCPNAGLPVGGGTIMSYCHLIGGTGINFNNGFGPQPAALIRNRVNAASCLLTCGTTCDAPALSTTALLPTSVTLSWTDVAATSYDLRWKPTSSGIWMTANGLTGTTYPLSGLTQATAYEFQVLTHCSAGGTSAYSPSLVFTTPIPCPDALEPNNTQATAAVITLPANVSALIVSASDVDFYSFSIAVTSTLNISVSGMPGDYDVRLLNAGGTQVAISENGSTSSEYISYSAAPGTYAVQVYGYNGAFSNVICYALNVSAVVPLCAMPSGLGSSNVQWNSATLTWSAVQGVTSYDLRWKPTSVQTWTTAAALATNTYALSGLTGNTAYEFQVKSNCQGGPTSEFSQSSTFTTTAPPCEVLPPILVAAKLLLEGPYNSSTQWMSDTLRVQGLVPLTQPYAAMGFTLTGTLATTAPVLGVTGSDAIVDWVLVELRDATTPSTVVERHAALVQRDGDVVAVDGVSPLGFCATPGPYKVAVRHRNHMGCMTLNAVTLAGSSTTIDFRTSTTVTYGSEARKTVGTAQVLWAGNTSADASVMYTGAGNDRDPILVRVGGIVPTNTVQGYYLEDVNMDGWSKYTGANNDRDPILVNVGGTTPNNTRTQQLP